MIKPLGARLLIVPIKQDHKTSGGIMLGEEIAPQSLKAEVLAVGPAPADRGPALIP